MCLLVEDISQYNVPLFRGTLEKEELHKRNYYKNYIISYF